MNFKRLLKSAIKMFRVILVKFKPLTVHTEAIFYEDVWDEIKDKMGQKEILKWYVMTPVNYNYFKSYFEVDYTKKEISKIMKERYLEMIREGEELQLHIHLHPTMKIGYTKQEKRIKEAVEWFEKNLGFKPKEIVFGWWLWDDNSEMIAGKYNLKIIKFDDYNAIHDYDWTIDCEGESYN